MPTMHNPKVTHVEVYEDNAGGLYVLEMNEQVPVRARTGEFSQPLVKEAWSAYIDGIESWEGKCEFTRHDAARCALIAMVVSDELTLYPEDMGAAGLKWAGLS